MSRNLFPSHLLRVALATAVALSASAALAQDWVRSGTGLGADKVRIAVASFKPVSGDAQTAPLKQTFDDTLYNDLQQAGVFDVVSKSLAPPLEPGSPQEIQLNSWAAAPANAQMVAFGALGATNDRLHVNGWLFDAKNTQSPQVLGKQYDEVANEGNARLIAHRFADAIILALGGGINGIAETKIYFVSARNGHKEIWQMDYDGQGAEPLTKLGGIALSPRVSPDSSRVAFVNLSDRGSNIRMYSLELGRMVSFGASSGSDYSPSWSPDGKLAFASSRSGDPEIWVSDSNGGAARRITSFHGPDVSPCWNPKGGGQIAWISGRSGLPQLYTMDADGTNIQRMTDGGYATSPSWSPNGQFLAFAWNRKYGPGAPGGQDIYIMDIASKRWIQLTHEAGRNDFPSWSPDSRHIVFESTRGGRSEIFTMLADGSQQHALTKGGSNTQPNWSWK
jgi:TolB protein